MGRWRKTYNSLIQMIKILFLIVFSLFGISIFAQDQVIPLWEGTAPGSENWSQEEVQYKNEMGQNMVRNVVIPTLTVYQPAPEKSTGTSIIVAPGGGFLFLSWQIEGTDVAEWLVEKGITVFLLKYRLTNSGDTQEEFDKSLAALYSAIDDASNTETTDKGTNLSRSEIAKLGQQDGRQAIKLVRSRVNEWEIDPNKIGLKDFMIG